MKALRLYLNQANNNNKKKKVNISEGVFFVDNMAWSI